MHERQRQRDERTTDADAERDVSSATLASSAARAARSRRAAMRLAGWIAAHDDAGRAAEPATGRPAAA